MPTAQAPAVQQPPPQPATTVTTTVVVRNPSDVLRDMGLLGLQWNHDDEAVEQLLKELLLKGFGLKGGGKPGAQAAQGGAPRPADALKDAVKDFQAQRGLPPSGLLDAVTAAALVEQLAPSLGAGTPGAETAQRAPVPRAVQEAVRIRTAGEEVMKAQNVLQRANVPVVLPQKTATLLAEASRPPLPSFLAPPPAQASASSASGGPPNVAQQAPPPSAAPPARPAPPASALPPAPPPMTQAPALPSGPVATALHGTPPPPRPEVPLPPSTTTTSTTTASPPPTTAAPAAPSASTDATPHASTVATAVAVPAGGAPSDASQRSAEGAVRESAQGAAHESPLTQDPPPAPAAGGPEVKAAGGAQDGSLARGDSQEQRGHQDGQGNQASGDLDVNDPRRGQAVVDDGSGKDEGAYEVPPLEEQVRTALDQVWREENQDERKTTTYAAEFILYKPGVYASETQPPCLLNLTVDTATAYDEVWMEALEKINKHIKRHEPQTWPFTVDDIHQAMQKARARSSE